MKSYMQQISDFGRIVSKYDENEHILSKTKSINEKVDALCKAIEYLKRREEEEYEEDEEEEETPSLKNLFIDIGCVTKEEVEKKGIHVGCVVTFEDEFMQLNDRYYVGRALDNRAGGFMIAEVARLLKENKKKQPFGLYIVNSVQ